MKPNPITPQDFWQSSESGLIKITPDGATASGTSDSSSGMAVARTPIVAQPRSVLKFVFYAVGTVSLGLGQIEDQESGHLKPHFLVKSRAYPPRKLDFELDFAKGSAYLNGEPDYLPEPGTYFVFAKMGKGASLTITSSSESLRKVHVLNYFGYRSVDYFLSEIEGFRWEETEEGRFLNDLILRCILTNKAKFFNIPKEIREEIGDDRDEYSFLPKDLVVDKMIALAQTPFVLPNFYSEQLSQRKEIDSIFSRLARIAVAVAVQNLDSSESLQPKLLRMVHHLFEKIPGGYSLSEEERTRERLRQVKHFLQCLKKSEFKAKLHLEKNKEWIEWILYYLKKALQEFDKMVQEEKNQVGEEKEPVCQDQEPTGEDKEPAGEDKEPAGQKKESTDQEKEKEPAGQEKEKASEDNEQIVEKKEQGGEELLED